MATLTKYDLNGSVVEEVSLDCQEDLSANSQMIKDYIVAIRNNRRQWSANTKGRKEVNHSKKKPHPQKGTGRARQGTLAAPQYKGGGVVFGPKPKNPDPFKINRKEKRLAIRHLLIQKVLAGDVCLLKETFDKDLAEPKTKKLDKFMRAIEFASKRTAFLIPREEKLEGKPNFRNLQLSVSNLQKVSFQKLENVNGYDLLVNQKLIITESALNELKELLTG